MNLSNKLGKASFYLSIEWYIQIIETRCMIVPVQLMALIGSLVFNSNIYEMSKNTKKSSNITCVLNEKVVHS